MARQRKPRKGKSPLAGPPPVVEGVKWACDAKIETIEWGVRNHLPLNTTTILEGDKEVGKSTYLAALAAAWSGGQAIPGYEGPKGGRFLWQAAEDTWGSVVVPRFVAAGGNTQMFGAVALDDGNGAERAPRIPTEIGLIENRIIQTGASLVIFDPLTSAVSFGYSLLQEEGCRAVMDALNALCVRRKVTIILVRHLKKNFRGPVLHAGYGHGALGAAARSIIRIDKDRGDPTRRLVSVVACNWAKERPTRVFSTVPFDEDYVSVEWETNSPLSAQEISEGCSTLTEEDQLADADLLLYSLIRDGSALVRDIMREAEEAGIPWGSVRTAKKRLGVESDREGGFGAQGRWCWFKPVKGWPEHFAVKALRVGAQNGSALSALGSRSANDANQEGAKAPKAPKMHAPAHTPPLTTEGGTENDSKTGT